MLVVSLAHNADAALGKAAARATATTGNADP
jgi:hypothetical protein